MDTQEHSVDIYAGKGLTGNDIMVVGIHMSMLAAYVGEGFRGDGRLPTNSN